LVICWDSIGSHGGQATFCEQPRGPQRVKV